MKEKCPYCSGSLIEQAEQVEIEYRGQAHLRPSLYSICDDCGSFVLTPRQTRTNKADTIELRRLVDSTA